MKNKNITMSKNKTSKNAQAISAKPMLSYREIWASDKRTNRKVESIMWYVDNVLLSKFTFR